MLAAVATQAAELRPGMTLAGRVSPGAADTQHFHAGAKQFVHLSVNQGETDLAIAVIAPGGRKIADRDGRERGPESVSFITEVAGEYALEVRALAPSAAVYHVTLDNPRAPQSGDEVRIRAEEASSAGKQLAAAPDANSQKGGLAREREALDLWREVGDSFQESATWAAIGDILYDSDEYEEARNDYLSALGINQRRGDRRAEAESLNNVGLCNWQLGNLQDAGDYFSRARVIWKELSFPYGDAATLTNQGLLEWQSGQYQDAMRHHLEALKIFQGLHDRQGEAFARNNLAVAFESLADYGQARFHLTRAIALFHDTRAGLAEGRARLRLARIELAEGNLPAARVLSLQALALVKDSEDRLSRAEILEQIGQVQEQEGKRTEALGEYREALRLFQEADSRRGQADAWHRLGAVLVTAGKLDEAGDALGRALELRRKVALPEGEAETLFEQSRLELARGHSAAAQADLQSALEISERVRGRVPGPQLRISYLSSKHKYYAASIDLYMTQHRENPTAGFNLRALETAERARARVLLDSIRDAPLRNRRFADPALVERERIVRREISFWAARVNDLHSPSGAGRGEDYARQRLDQVLAEDTDLQVRLAMEGTKGSDPANPQPYSVSVIQHELLDSQTLLLEYAVGERRSYLWAVSQDRVDTVTLPARPRIEKAVLKAYSLTSVSPLGGHRETGEELTELSRMLLGPVSPWLGVRRLVIVADGLVDKAPFAALPDPSTGRSLIDSHEIAMLPSASTLVLLRRERNARRPPEKELAVFADPVYSAQDPRFKNPPKEQPASREWRFERLPFSHLEAEEILKLAPPGPSLSATGFAATREAVESPALADYRILHFAVHSVIDDENPALSGIVLSLYSSSGEKRDGFLRVEDILNLEISSDLVVLSSCRSATGVESGVSEGLATLAKAFFYAGGGRVAATLWKVDDAATAQFMSLFYTAMFRSHLAPCAALGAAQRAMEKDERFSDPYYWSGFVLQGEWL